MGLGVFGGVGAEFFKGGCADFYDFEVAGELVVGTVERGVDKSVVGSGEAFRFSRTDGSGDGYAEAGQENERNSTHVYRLPENLAGWAFMFSILMMGGSDLASPG
jgi:hypothetical protein